MRSRRLELARFTRCCIQWLFSGCSALTMHLEVVVVLLGARSEGHIAPNRFCLGALHQVPNTHSVPMSLMSLQLQQCQEIPVPSYKYPYGSVPCFFPPSPFETRFPGFNFAPVSQDRHDTRRFLRGATPRCKLEAVFGGVKIVNIP